MNLDRFVQEGMLVVEAEREVETKLYEHLSQNHSLKDIVKAGIAVTGLVLKKESAASPQYLRLKVNDNVALVETGQNPLNTLGSKVVGLIYKITKVKISVLLDDKEKSGSFNSGQVFSLIKSGDNVTFQR